MPAPVRYESRFSELIKSSPDLQINAGLAAAVSGLDGGALSIVMSSQLRKLSRKGLSGSRIAAQLDIPAGSVFAILKRTRND
jgi:hypothetical protein